MNNNRGFIFESTKKIIFGNGSISNLQNEIQNLGGKSVLFICDPAIEKMKFFDDILNILKTTKLNSVVFSKIESDPGFECCDAARDIIIESKSDIVVGIGGGSAMDIAKVAAITAITGNTAKELAKNSGLCKKGLPIILIPTTAGTGSEVTHISIFSDNDELLKTGIVSPYLYADVAILDPELTLSLPKHVTAHSGVDAIIHALEAFTSKKATALTDLLAEEAFGILFRNIYAAFVNENDIDARSNMLYGSMLAGKAFANSSVAAVHAFSYPIGAEFHIPHGLANSIMLIPVLKFNMIANSEKYCRLAKIIGVQTNGLTEFEITQKLINKLEILLDSLEINRNLSNYGVQELDIPRLANSAMKVTRLLSNNPREICIDDAERLYMEAM